MESYEFLVGLVAWVVIVMICYFILKYLFKAIKAIFGYFKLKVKNSDSTLQSLLHQEENKAELNLSSTTKKTQNPVLNLIKKIFITIFEIIKGIFIFIWKVLDAIRHEFTRHCEKCDSEDIEKLGSKKIDRYISTKAVYETLASGKRRKKYLQCTIEKYRDDYRCKACGHEFSETWTKEL